MDRKGNEECAPDDECDHDGDGVPRVNGTSPHQSNHTERGYCISCLHFRPNAKVTAHSGQMPHASRRQPTRSICMTRCHTVRREGFSTGCGK